MWKFVTLLAFTLMLVRADEEADSAKDGSRVPFLIVNKALSATEIIQGGEVSVALSITNVGRSPAFKVSAADNLNGPHSEKFASIAAGQTVTFKYSAKFNELGAFPCDSAKVTYAADETEGSAQLVALSTQANEELEGQGVDKSPVISVLTPYEYERKHTRYIKEWVLYVLLLSVPLGLPFYLYSVRSSELAALEKKN
eukprot:PhF_6_TR8059/c0_g1_i1/m.12476/K13250/SSR2; translocon-associated protein subunit beta